MRRRAKETTDLTEETTRLTDAIKDVRDQVHPLTEPTDWVAGHAHGVEDETKVLRSVSSDLAAETQVRPSETAERDEELTALANELPELANVSTELAEQTNGLTVEMHLVADARELLTEPM
jgi:hypothetical protein